MTSLPEPGAHQDATGGGQAAAPWVLAAVLWLAGCTAANDPGTPARGRSADDHDPCAVYDLPCDSPSWPPNVLLVIGDDTGLDMVRHYGAHPDAPPTPTLDRLAAQGVTFSRAYSMPWCSPTRAGILTGRYGRRYGLGSAIPVSVAGEASLPLDEATLPELLDSGSPWQWEHALVGKWHLTTLPDGGPTAALDHGFDHHVGSLGNLYQIETFDGQPQDYYDWERVVDGKVRRSRGYATTVNVNDALKLAADLEAPWLIWLAFNAAHHPFQAPPPRLHGYRGLRNAPEAIRYRAMVEAMDRELGRLLDGLAPQVRDRTIVIFVGDNGTDHRGLMGDWEDRPCKSTVYEAGVHVPLIVAGPIVRKPGSTSDALVHTNDLFATILDIAGVPDARRPAQLDSVSLLPQLLDPSRPSSREVVFSEAFKPNGPGPYRSHQQMLRDERYKLVVNSEGTHELYDLSHRILEGESLLSGELTPEQRRAYEALLSRLERGEF